MNRKRYFFAALLGLCSYAGGEEDQKKLQIQGEVPEGWEVVESMEAPVVERWVELANGEKKKISLRPFVLRPIADKESKFSVMDPLKISSGLKFDDVLNSQNENLVQTQDELDTMLQRLRSLLATLPTQTETKKES